MNPRTGDSYIVYMLSPNGCLYNGAAFRDLAEAELNALSRQRNNPSNTYYIAQLVGVTRRVDKPQYEVERV